MSDNRGWIKIDRGIIKHWLWDDASKLKAWIDLIMLANYEDKKTTYKGDIITCKRGDVNLSILNLSKRWGWSRNKTRVFLHTLEKDNMIVIKATTHRTTITIVNYGKYQDKGTTKSTTKDTTKGTTKGQQEVQQRDTTKKDKEMYKKCKEEKKEILPSASDFDDEDDDEWLTPEEAKKQYEEYLKRREQGLDE